MTVAIQGEEGSFHHVAATIFFDQNFELLPCDSFREVFQSLDRQEVDTGLVAIENSLYGSIHETYDMLIRYNFSIVGEITLPIHQQLIVNPGTKPNQITQIYSHPAALDQCRNYIELHYPAAEIVEHHDTAAAVGFIKSNQLTSAAAIASNHAAALHDMSILEKNIEDHQGNFTRFVIIKREPTVAEKPTKASLILTTNHEPGALYEALGVFKNHGVNLTKLESRPIRGEAFKYQFLVDVLSDTKSLEEICSELQQQNCQVKELGHYYSSN